MDKVCGKGAMVAAVCVMLCCICAECFPLAFLFLAIAWAGISYDSYTGKKKAPRNGCHRYRVHW